MMTEIKVLRLIAAREGRRARFVAIENTAAADPTSKTEGHQ
jgi:hypothetical protein